MEALLVTLVGVLVAGVLTGVGWMVRLVFKHESTDATLLSEVKNLGSRMDRLEERMDRMDHKLGAVVESLARIEGKLSGGA